MTRYFFFVSLMLFGFQIVAKDFKESTIFRKAENELYVYVLKDSATQNSYDEALAVACIQGIINRKVPRLYIKSNSFNRPDYWLDKFSSNGWLSNKKQIPVSSLDQLVQIAGQKLKGIIIWDPSVPATINVATTLAGLENGVVLSPEMAGTYQKKWNLPVIKDFRGQFTGKETGSKKNDAYRWAIREYIETGRCNPHWLSLYEDAYMTREKGNISYVITRDWAVYNSAFVFDLSPWGDETPVDDKNQVLGTDLETYKLMLEANMKQANGEQMTEVTGFFSFAKYSNIPGYPSKHNPIATEWETVYLISPYNCYQNTAADNCYNQSIHSQASIGNMKQERPKLSEPQKGKIYICILMADYDSSTPLYDFIPTHWDDSRRGDIPLLWGVNPNLSETYPDIMKYLYDTKTDNDFFAADASAAGYINPNRIDTTFLPLFIEHNKKYYNQWDMSISPMVLDQDEPTDAVKDAYQQFSPDGFATIVIDYHDKGGKLPHDQVWKDMPVTELKYCLGVLSDENLDWSAERMSQEIPAPEDHNPKYYLFRIIWSSPGYVISLIDKLKEIRPELDIEVVDPYNFFNSFKITNTNSE